MVRKRIVFYGRVQGVGFRYYCVQKANMLNLTGWVENLPSGTVLAEIQGREEDIELLIQYLQQRKWVIIERMEISRLPLEKEREFYERW